MPTRKRPIRRDMAAAVFAIGSVWVSKHTSYVSHELAGRIEEYCWLAWMISWISCLVYMYRYVKAQMGAQRENITPVKRQSLPPQPLRKYVSADGKAIRNQSTRGARSKRNSIRKVFRNRFMSRAGAAGGESAGTHINADADRSEDARAELDEHNAMQ